MLKETDCRPSFWVTVMKTAIYIQNRLLSKTIIVKEIKITVEANELTTAVTLYEL